MDLQEERMLLRTLLTSDYGEFKRQIFGDPLAVLPPHGTLRDHIELHLQRKYGSRYQAESYCLEQIEDDAGG